MALRDKVRKKVGEMATKSEARAEKQAARQAKKTAKQGNKVANKATSASAGKTPGSAGLRSPGSGGLETPRQRNMRLSTQGPSSGQVGSRHVVGGPRAAGKLGTGLRVIGSPLLGTAMFEAGRAGVAGVEGMLDGRGFSEGAMDTATGNAVGEGARTMAAITQGDPSLGLRRNRPIDAGTVSLSTDLERGEQRPENMRTDPQGRGPRGVIDEEGRRFEVTTDFNNVTTAPAGGDTSTPEEVEAANTPGAQDPAREAENEEEEINWGPTRTRGGRLRLDGNRPETVGRDGTRIRSARGDEAEAARLQLGAPAPDLPGVPPDEQEIIQVTDGQGGVGTLRAPAGARQGGGTFSTMSNVANAAVPVDNEGLHQARLAAIQRGERVPGVGDGESRRARLRREINSSRGLNQSFGSMIQEGIRRRQAQGELDQMNEARLRRLDNAAAMRRTMAGRQPTALDVAEYQSDQREQQAQTAEQQREEFRTIIDRASERTNEDGDTYIDTNRRNRLESLARRSGWDISPQGAQVAMDVMEVSDALNDAIQNENEFQVADLWGGGPDNPLSNVPAIPVSIFTDLFGLSGQRPSDPQTIQDGLAQILDMRHTRTDEEIVPWDQDDRIVEVNGTEIKMSDIPSSVRTLIDHIRARAGQEGLYNPDAPSGVMGGG